MFSGPRWLAVFSVHCGPCLVLPLLRDTRHVVMIAGWLADVQKTIRPQLTKEAARSGHIAFDCILDGSPYSSLICADPISALADPAYWALEDGADVELSGRTLSPRHSPSPSQLSLIWAGPVLRSNSTSR